MEVHRGEVFYADLSPVVGSEQGGIRPVLIVQNEIGNRHSPTVIAAAITSRLDKARLPTHINIRAADTGLAKDSVVLLEQIRTACGGRAVIINSGYRTAAYNKKVGGAPLSQHLLAKAADIRVEGMTAKQVYDIANRLNPNGGVGKYASFTHVDVRDGRARW